RNPRARARRLTGRSSGGRFWWVAPLAPAERHPRGTGPERPSMGVFALFPAQEAVKGQVEQGRAEDQTEKTTEGAVTERAEGIEDDGSAHDPGEDRARGVDRLVRNFDAAHQGKHHREAEQVEPERPPESVASADADFAKQPGKSTEEEETVGKRIH